MNLEQIQQEVDNLKLIDPNNITAEQMIQLVEKLSLLVDNSESSLLEIKSQLDKITFTEEINK